MSVHEATLEFDYERAATASVVAASVAREIGEIDDERSRTRIESRDRTIEIDIEARDVTALRAALNTWFTLVDVAERTARLGDRFGQGTSTDEAE